jgi:hypothetical protein
MAGVHDPEGSPRVYESVDALIETCRTIGDESDNNLSNRNRPSDQRLWGSLVW